MCFIEEQEYDDGIRVELVFFVQFVQLMDILKEEVEEEKEDENGEEEEPEEEKGMMNQAKMFLIGHSDVSD